MEVNGHQQIFSYQHSLSTGPKMSFVFKYTYYEECVSKLLTVAIDFHSKEKIQ